MITLMCRLSSSIPKKALHPVQGMLSAADINNPNIKDKFSGTDLYPENLEDFLADVVYV